MISVLGHRTKNRHSSSSSGHFWFRSWVVSVLRMACGVGSPDLCAYHRLCAIQRRKDDLQRVFWNCEDYGVELEGKYPKPI